MRQTIKEVEVNVACRWFIGYDLIEPIPHFSTFGKNYTRRFKGSDIFENIFHRILKEITESGFIDASAVFIDGTHIKANVNRNKKEKITVKKPVKQYRDELEEFEQDRKKHGKKPLKKQKNTAEEKEITKNISDPESGMFVKGKYERCFAYVANTACGRHNFIPDFEVGAGNSHDSQMFHEVYKKPRNQLNETESIEVDAGYKTPGNMHRQ